MDSGRAAITAAVITGVLGVVAAAVALVPNLLDKGSGTGGGGETPTIVSGEVQLFANKESGPVGATVQVSGKGFAGGESVEISFGAERAGTTRTAAGGDFANV